MTSAPDKSAPLWFLLLVVALNGAAILAIQIVGGKLLAPYLGSSHFVWTAQILVTLLALTFGYHFGGRMADRSRPTSWLFGFMLAAAAYLVAALPMTEAVAFRCLTWSLPVGSLAAGAFLFLVPLLLLAITGPFLLRAMPLSAANLGTQSGRLSAVSTFGSVAGALIAGLWLIPSFQNVVSLHATASALALVSAIYFLVWGAGPVARATASLLALGVIAGGAIGIRPQTHASYKNWTELERRNSPFGLMQIIKSRTTPQVALINDFLMQNSYDPTTRHSLLAFSYMEHGLARAYHTNAGSVLVVGMGVGIVPRMFAEEGARVETVEINPEYVDLGQRYFHLDTNQFQIHLEDGRYFLHRTTNRYDVVVLDAFLGDSPPSHLMTREAFASARDVMREGGVFIMNAFGDFDLAPDGFFLSSMEKTLAAVFRTVRIHSTGNGNVFFVASMRDELEMGSRPSLRKVHATKVKEVRTGFETLITTDPSLGRVLTDDYNPVDFYDAGNRERIRRSMVEAVKGF